MWCLHVDLDIFYWSHLPFGNWLQILIKDHILNGLCDVICHMGSASVITQFEHSNSRSVQNYLEHVKLSVTNVINSLPNYSRKIKF
jgi:hypothetical protein